MSNCPNCQYDLDKPRDECERYVVRGAECSTWDDDYRRISVRLERGYYAHGAFVTIRNGWYAFRDVYETADAAVARVEKIKTQRILELEKTLERTVSSRKGWMEFSAFDAVVKP